jgi:hypothetical protein
MTTTMTVTFEIADNGVLCPVDPILARTPNDSTLRVFGVPAGTDVRLLERQLERHRPRLAERKAIDFDELV